jgi:hypothetical protein
MCLGGSIGIWALQGGDFSILPALRKAKGNFMSGFSILRFAPISIGAFVLCIGAVSAQPALDLPRQSPQASVSQTFGYATVTVKYSRPAVNGRNVWGGLVPYGQVWRTGANEPTTVEFNREVAVNGATLAAGIYGLFMLPEKVDGKESWTFIFSRNSKGWGAFGYDAKDDALRVTVTPEKSAARERMEFSFESISDGNTFLVLHWGGKRGTLSVTSEFLETGKASIAAWLPKAKADEPYAWLGAARFYWTNNIDHNQAMEWIDRSIAIKPLFGNLWVKAQWLSEEGRCKEALETLELARVAAGNDLSQTSQLPTGKALAKWCR